MVDRGGAEVSALVGFVCTICERTILYGDEPVDRFVMEMKTQSVTTAQRGTQAYPLHGKGRGTAECCSARCLRIALDQATVIVGGWAESEVGFR